MYTNKMREAAANMAFRSYDFGDGVTAKNEDEWAYSSTSEEWCRSVYVVLDGSPGPDTTRLNFVVRFEADSAKMLEIYAADTTGSIWGSMPKRR